MCVLLAVGCSSSRPSHSASALAGLTGSGTERIIASRRTRFGLASALLFLGCLIFRQNLRLTRAQHLAALGQGAFAFSVSYSFTYASEGLVASAIVAVT